MKHFAFLTILTLLLVSTTEAKTTRVRGYINDNGTYVAPHYRTSPDGSQFNNYSSQGSYNPYTGQRGYANPYYVAPNPAPSYTPTMDTNSINSTWGY
jgi:hypothetical protein